MLMRIHNLWKNACKDVEILEEKLAKKKHDLEVVKSYGVEENKTMLQYVLTDIDMLEQKIESRKTDAKRYKKYVDEHNEGGCLS